jgi:hypothetical protein
MREEEHPEHPTAPLARESAVATAVKTITDNIFE